MNQPYLNIEGEWVRLLTEDDISDIMTSLELRQQRKGEWLISEDKGHALCSECTDKVYFLSKYCPNCGARMIEHDPPLNVGDGLESFIKHFED